MWSQPALNQSLRIAYQDGHWRITLQCWPKKATLQYCSHTTPSQILGMQQRILSVDWLLLLESLLQPILSQLTKRMMIFGKGIQAHQNIFAWTHGEERTCWEVSNEGIDDWCLMLSKINWTTSASHPTRLSHSLTSSLHYQLLQQKYALWTIFSMDSRRRECLMATTSAFLCMTRFLQCADGQNPSLAEYENIEKNMPTIHHLFCEFGYVSDDI